MFPASSSTLGGRHSGDYPRRSTTRMIDNARISNCDSATVVDDETRSSRPVSLGDQLADVSRSYTVDDDSEFLGSPDYKIGKLNEATTDSLESPFSPLSQGRTMGTPDTPSSNEAVDRGSFMQPPNPTTVQLVKRAFLSLGTVQLAKLRPYLFWEEPSADDIAVRDAHDRAKLERAAQAGLDDFTSLPLPEWDAEREAKVMEELHATSRAGRMPLILDVDNTLVHCSRRRRPVSQYAFVVNGQEWYFTLRPGVVEFLRAVVGSFDVYFYTLAIRPYALYILRTLEVLVGQPLPLHRVLTRTEACAKFHKSLLELFPHEEAALVVDDNHGYVWRDSPALVLIPPFHCADCPGAVADQHLGVILELLLQVHAVYALFLRAGASVTPVVCLKALREVIEECVPPEMRSVLLRADGRVAVVPPPAALTVGPANGVKDVGLKSPSPPPLPPQERCDPLPSFSSSEIIKRSTEADNGRVEEEAHSDSVALHKVPLRSTFSLTGAASEASQVPLLPCSATPASVPSVDTAIVEASSVPDTVMLQPRCTSTVPSMCGGDSTPTAPGDAGGYGSVSAGPRPSDGRSGAETPPARPLAPLRTGAPPSLANASVDEAEVSTDTSNSSTPCALQTSQLILSSATGTATEGTLLDRRGVFRRVDSVTIAAEESTDQERGEGEGDFSAQPLNSLLGECLRSFSKDNDVLCTPQWVEAHECGPLLNPDRPLASIPESVGLSSRSLHHPAS